MKVWNWVWKGTLKEIKLVRDIAQRAQPVKRANITFRQTLNNLKLNQFKIMPERIVLWDSSLNHDKFWKLTSDKEIEGKSTIEAETKETTIDSPECIKVLYEIQNKELDTTPGELQFPSTINSKVFRVKGNLNLDVVDKGEGEIKHSGYAAIISEQFRPFVDGTQFDSIEFVTKTDGRVYIANITIYTEYDDVIFQSFFTTPPNQWSVVSLPLHKFVMSYEGLANTDQMSSLKHSIQRIGILMAERKYGPFDFEIASISLVSESTLKRQVNRFDGLPDITL